MSESHSSNAQSLLLDNNFISISFAFIFHHRVMAAALSLTFGRGGALLGNLLFGFLIDLNCVVPIVLFSAMLFSKKQFNNTICSPNTTFN